MIDVTYLDGHYETFDADDAGIRADGTGMIVLTNGETEVAWLNWMEVRTVRKVKIELKDVAA